jgi:hypothetical protein
VRSGWYAGGTRWRVRSWIWRQWEWEEGQTEDGSHVERYGTVGDRDRLSDAKLLARFEGTGKDPGAARQGRPNDEIGLLSSTAIDERVRGLRRAKADRKRLGPPACRGRSG